MDNRLSSLDWSLIQVFVAVAGAGSLSGAARQLGTSQPTVGRQVKALEEALGTELFLRRQRGLELSETGAALLPHARQMQAAVAALGLAAAGRSGQLSGPVRITAPVFFAQHILPPVLSGLRRDEPRISIDLVANDATDNLLFREADIAVRMYRPDQLDLIARHLGDIEIGIFAARDWLERTGTPPTLDAALSRDIVGYDTLPHIVDGLRAYGHDRRREDFPVRTDSHSAYFELVRAGCGIGFLQARVAARFPELVRLFPEVPLPPLPVWLAAHETMRRTPRIRRVWQALEQGLSPYVS